MDFFVIILACGLPLLKASICRISGLGRELEGYSHGWRSGVCISQERRGVVSARIGTAQLESRCTSVGEYKVQRKIIYRFLWSMKVDMENKWMLCDRNGAERCHTWGRFCIGHALVCEKQGL